MAWRQQGDRESGVELVARKRGGLRYAEIERDFWGWRASVFTGESQGFATEAEAEEWVRHRLAAVVRDLSEIEEMYK